MRSDAIRVLRRRLVFNVVNPPADRLAGLPCFRPNKRWGHTWGLPLFVEAELAFSIGQELGLAFLRLMFIPGSAMSPYQMDQTPLELAEFVAAHDRGKGRNPASPAYASGFLSCIGAFIGHALNARQTLPELRRRLAALDDAALRGRCLAILDGKPVADIFDPEGLSFVKLVKPAAPVVPRQGGRP